MWKKYRDFGEWNITIFYIFLSEFADYSLFSGILKNFMTENGYVTSKAGYMGNGGSNDDEFGVVFGGGVWDN